MRDGASTTGTLDGQSPDVAESENGDVDPRDAVTAWAIENLIWILGLVPILLSAIRIYAVSGGDEAVLRALVEDLDVVALFLATVLPVLPYYWLFLGVALLDSTVLNANRKRRCLKRAIYSAPFFVLGIFTMQWSASSWVIVAVLVLVIFVYGVIAKWKHRAFPGVKIGLVLLVASVLAMFVAIRFPWIPAELIEVRGEPVQRGYVLKESDDRLTVMWRDGGLQLLNQDQIIDRQYCTSETKGPAIIFGADAPDVVSPTLTEKCVKDSSN